MQRFLGTLLILGDNKFVYDFKKNNYITTVICILAFLVEIAISPLSIVRGVAQLKKLI